MTQTKQLPCCARRTAQLHSEKGNLAQLARKAANAHMRGRSVARFREMIAESKALIARYEQGIIDHESEHAA